MTPSFDEFLNANQNCPAPPPDAPAPASFDAFLGNKTGAKAPPPAPASPTPAVAVPITRSSAPPSPAPKPVAVQPAGQSMDEILLLLPPDGGSYRCGPGEFVYSYHQKQRDACEHQKRPLMSRMKPWGPAEFLYFRVRPNHLVRLPFFDVSLADTGGQLRLIECRISILGLAPNQEAKAVAELAGPSTPLENFQAFVTKWLDEYVFAQRHHSHDPLQDFNETQRAAASVYVTGQALAVLGMRIECKLAFPEHDLRLPVLSLHLDEVRVQEMGLPGPLTSHLEVRLGLPKDQQDLTDARRRSRSQETIRQDLEGIAREWFQHECSLEWFAFHQPSVQQALADKFRAYAQGTLGMGLHSLALRNSLGFPTAFRIRTKYTSTATVRGNYKLQVEHQLGVVRKNLGLFYTQGPRLPAGNALPVTSQDAWNGAFEDWVHTILNDLTDNVLFDKDYADVGLNFESLCTQIKQKVTDAFDQIGFDVNPFISIPDDIQIQNCLEHKFTFDTGAVHCKTREAGANYSVSAHVHFEVDSLEKIKKYLHPGKPLKDHFIETAKEAIENAVRTLTPEALYTRFDAEGPDGECSPERVIHEALQAAMRDKFGAIIEDNGFEAALREDPRAQRRTIAITLTAEPTEVTTLFDQLKPYTSHRCPLEVETRGSMGERVELNVLYRITSIATDGWSRFQEQCRKNPEMDTRQKAKEIKDAIDTAFRTKAGSRLISLPPDLLLSPHQDVPKVIEQVSLNDAVKEVAEFLGLAVRIMDIERPPGKWTLRSRGVTETNYQEAEVDHREARLALRAAQTEYGPDDDRTKEAAERLGRSKKALEGFTNREDKFFADAPDLLKPRWDHLQLGPSQEGITPTLPGTSEPADKPKPAPTDEPDHKSGDAKK